MSVSGNISGVLTPLSRKVVLIERVFRLSHHLQIMFVEWMPGKITDCLPIDLIFCLLPIVGRHLKRQKSHVTLPGTDSMLHTCFLRISSVTVLTAAGCIIKGLSPSEADCTEIWGNASLSHICSMCTSICCRNTTVWQKNIEVTLKTVEIPCLGLNIVKRF